MNLVNFEIGTQPLKPEWEEILTNENQRKRHQKSKTGYKRNYVHSKNLEKKNIYT